MRLFALALIGILVCGCTVYKSSDRDDFDANGKARAPQSQAASLTRDDRALLANPCAAFDVVSDEQLKSLFGPSPRLSMMNEVSPKTSTCLVTSASSDLSAPAILTCSWKPMNGERIPVTDAFAVQTTEDELREEGYDVVTSTVIAGERLRMNCEAYVPTPALIEDRRMGETATLELTNRFSTFAHELAIETLPIDVQH